MSRFEIQYIPPCPDSDTTAFWQIVDWEPPDGKVLALYPFHMAIAYRLGFANSYSSEPVPSPVYIACKFTRPDGSIQDFYDEEYENALRATHRDAVKLREALINAMRDCCSTRVTLQEQSLPLVESES